MRRKLLELETNIQDWRNGKRAFFIEVNKPNLYSMQVVRHIDEAYLKSVDILGSIVEPNLHAVNSRKGRNICEASDLKPCDRGGCLIVVCSECELQAKYSGFIGVDISEAGELETDGGCVSFCVIEKSGDGNACESLFGDVSEESNINTQDISVFSPEDARSHSCHIKIRGGKLHGGRNID